MGAQGGAARVPVTLVREAMDVLNDAVDWCGNQTRATARSLSGMVDAFRDAVEAMDNQLASMDVWRQSAAELLGGSGATQPDALPAAQSLLVSPLLRVFSMEEETALRNAVATTTEWIDTAASVARAAADSIAALAADVSVVWEAPGEFSTHPAVEGAVIAATTAIKTLCALPRSTVVAAIAVPPAWSSGIRQSTQPAATIDGALHAALVGHGAIALPQLWSHVSPSQAVGSASTAPLHPGATALAGLFAALRLLDAALSLRLALHLPCVALPTAAVKVELAVPPADLPAAASDAGGGAAAGLPAAIAGLVAFRGPTAVSMLQASLRAVSESQPPCTAFLAAGGRGATAIAEVAKSPLVATAAALERRGTSWATMRLNSVLAAGDEPLPQRLTSALREHPDDPAVVLAAASTDTAVLSHPLHLASSADGAVDAVKVPLLCNDAVAMLEAQLVFMGHKPTGASTATTPAAWSYAPSTSHDRTINDFDLPPSIPKALAKHVRRARKQVRWAKVRGFPFWPAVAFEPDDPAIPLAHRARVKEQTDAGLLLVRLFGAHPLAAAGRIAVGAPASAAPGSDDACFPAGDGVRTCG